MLHIINKPLYVNTALAWKKKMKGKEQENILQTRGQHKEMAKTGYLESKIRGNPESQSSQASLGNYHNMTIYQHYSLILSDICMIADVTFFISFSTISVATSYLIFHI